MSNYEVIIFGFMREEIWEKFAESDVGGRGGGYWVRKARKW